MFKPHQNFCVKCGDKKLIVVKAMLCAKCNHDIKQEKKKDEVRIKPRIQPIANREEKIKTFGELKQKYELKRTPLKRTALKKKFPKNTGQLEVFNRIWATREHRCEVCDEPIRRVDGGVRMFSHVVSKGSYKDLMLDEENILLMGDGLYGNCDHHTEWEHRTEDMHDIEMWKPIFLLHEALKRKSDVTNKGKE